MFMPTLFVLYLSLLLPSSLMARSQDDRPVNITIPAFQPKGEGVAPSDDTPDEAARKTADAWMKLWDEGNYDQSYDELAEEAKKKFTRRHWYVLWYGLRRPLGKVKTRRLTRIVMGIDEQRTRAVQYETLFENRKEEVRETLALTLEKDGKWRVFTYVNNIEPPGP